MGLNCNDCLVNVLFLIAELGLMARKEWPGKMISTCSKHKSMSLNTKGGLLFGHVFERLFIIINGSVSFY